jgi:pyruvate ferredoxin oxidoreductase gamma subunit
VLEPSLVCIDVREGMKKSSVLVVNSDKPVEVDGRKTFVFDATNLALKSIGKDIVNTAILGSFAKATGLVTLESLIKAVNEKFPGKLGELNVKMVRDAYEQTKI